MQMTTAASEVLWEAVSGLAAAGALTLSIVVLITQRSRDRRQELIQERLAEIEDARRHDEVRSRDQAQDRALIADVRVCEFRMERPGGAGQSDKVSITIENRGPALARRLDLALLEDEKRAPSNHLGSVVERLRKANESDDEAFEAYFEIPWELPTPRPLEALSPDERITFPFWLRYRQIGNVGMRVIWVDGRGEQITRVSVPFNKDASGRY